MKISCLTLAAAGLISVSEGYKLSFYGGANCRSTPLGVQYPVVDPPNYVCRGIPANAQSVVITAQDGPDGQSSASFPFSSPDLHPLSSNSEAEVIFRQPEGCGGGIIQTGTGGCVNINNARSYQIHYR
jgi:hypothetical protein